MILKDSISWICTISGFPGVGVCAGEQRDHGAAAAHPDQDPAHRRWRDQALACRALVLILYPVSVFDSNSGGAGRACQVIHRHADHVQALDFQQRGKF